MVAAPVNFKKTKSSKESNKISKMPKGFDYNEKNY